MTSASLAIAEADETTKLTKGLTTSILERIGMTPTSSAKGVESEHWSFNRSGNGKYG